MKTTTLVLILFLTVRDLWAQTPTAPVVPPQPSAAPNNPTVAPALPGLSTPQTGAPAAVVPATPPNAAAVPPSVAATPPNIPAMTPGTPAVSPASDAAPEKEVPGYDFNFPGVDVKQVLEVYAGLVNRTLLIGAMPNASVTLKTQSKLTKTEAIEALQAVLALNGIVVVPIGEKFVKVLPPGEAGMAGGALDSTDAAHLPDLGTYVTHITQLKYIKPSAIIPLIQPFAKLNSLTSLDDNGILVMRDYAENIKRMLEMIDKIDISVPAVYISEVIPIRYAQADDIANALNSLGGSGGATVSVGSSSAAPTISGVAGNRAGGPGYGGLGGTTPQAGINSPGGQFGQQRAGLGAQAANPNGTPSASTPFQQRLLNIINRAGSTTGGGGGGGQEPIQIFGMAKIIADERANSLLVYATRQDMDAITNVIAKLDVLLAQVLIESVIVDYSLGPDTLNVGVSASQSPKGYFSEPLIQGAGGYNNGQQFFNFVSKVIGTNSGASTFGNGLGGGLSYFGNLGNNWNATLTAAAADSHASIIQRPRIQTSQAKPAQFFVGDTVPYVTSTYNYGGAYGNQSSYSQLSVGVELDVTPFINPDGLVVMQIAQEIDDLNGYTTITGVGQIPNTIKRTLNSEIAVKNQDTVMLGGFIKNSKSNSKSGVPLLQDIPLLGGLFSQRNSSKAREELIVLMRPTVLKTPEIAAQNTITEERRLPGVSAAAADEGSAEQKLIDAERKKELSHPKTMSQGFFNAHVPTNAPDGQTPPPVVIPWSQEQSPQPQAQGNGFATPVAPTAPEIPANNKNNTAPPP